MKVALLLHVIPDKSAATGKSAHKIRSFNIAFVIKVCVGPSSIFCQTDHHGLESLGEKMSVPVYEGQNPDNSS